MSAALVPWFARAALEYAQVGGHFPGRLPGKITTGKFQLLAVISGPPDMEGQDYVWAEIGDKDCWLYAKIPGEVVRNFDSNRAEDAHLLTLAWQIFLAQDYAWIFDAPKPAGKPAKAPQLCIRLSAFKCIGGGDGTLISHHPDGKLNNLRKSPHHLEVADWVARFEARQGEMLSQEPLGLSAGDEPLKLSTKDVTMRGSSPRSNPTKPSQSHNPYSLSRSGSARTSQAGTPHPPPPRRAVYESPFDPVMLVAEDAGDSFYPSDRFLAKIAQLAPLTQILQEPSTALTPSPSSLASPEPEPEPEAEAEAELSQASPEDGGEDEEDELDELDDSQHLPTPRIETQFEPSPSPQPASFPGPLSVRSPQPTASSSGFPVAGQAQHRERGLPTDYGSQDDTTRFSDVTHLMVLTNVDGQPTGAQAQGEDEAELEDEELVEESMEDIFSQAEEKPESEDVLDGATGGDVEMADEVEPIAPPPPPAREPSARLSQHQLAPVPAPNGVASREKAEVAVVVETAVAQPSRRSGFTVDDKLRAKGVAPLSWLECAVQDGTGLEKLVAPFLARVHSQGSA